MSFTICNLASGSGGNCTYLETNNSAILIDCGLGPRQMKWRLESREIQPDKIRAMFVTHEHNDHIGGAYKFAKQYKIPIYLTEGTWKNARIDKSDVQSIWVKSEDIISIGDMKIQPFSVSHDTKEPVGFRVDTDEKSALIMTDTGTVEFLDVKKFTDIDFLLIEANYDKTMLANGPYNHFLKLRVSSDLGHLSNHQTGRWVAKVLQNNLRLKQILLGHLSEKNNLPEIALDTISETVQSVREIPVAVANQHKASNIYAV